MRSTSTKQVNIMIQVLELPEVLQVAPIYNGLCMQKESWPIRDPVLSRPCALDTFSGGVTSTWTPKVWSTMALRSFCLKVSGHYQHPPNVALLRAFWS